MEREIVVRGTGEARALPDQASLRVEVTADHKTQEEAHDARTKLAARVDEVLSRRRGARARDPGGADRQGGRGSGVHDHRRFGLR
jgi:uncharacterized protein YggE